MICNNVILVTVILTQTMPHQTKTPSWPMTRDTSRCPKKLRAYLSCTALQLPTAVSRQPRRRSVKCHQLDCSALVVEALNVSWCRSVEVLGRRAFQVVFGKRWDPRCAFFLSDFINEEAMQFKYQEILKGQNGGVSHLDDQLFSEW